MSITEVKGKPGWYNVRVYDRVQVPGERPRPVDQRVKGKTNAENVERELKNKRDEGSLIGRNTHLSDYAAAYLRTRRAEIGRQTLHGYTVIVDRYISRHSIGTARVGSITVSMVADFYADLMDGEGRDVKEENGKTVPADPVAAETVRGVHRVLSMTLKRATVDGFLRANPCQVAKPPKDVSDDDEKEPERGLDPQDARELLTALTGTEVYTAAAVALGTGLRRSELLALRWQDLDLKAMELSVNGKLEEVDGITLRTATKTRRSKRSVPFSDAVRAIFKAQKVRAAECRLAVAKDKLWSAEGWVFPSLNVSLTKDKTVLPAGRWWTPGAFAQAWRRSMKEANGRLLGAFVAAGGAASDFEPCTAGVHALRHTYATMQLRAGVRDEIVSRRLGHSSSLITRRVYSHATQEEKREGVDVTDAALGTVD